MSLDQNLFTLVFQQNKDHPNVIDLVDPSGTVHYHKRRVAGAEYKIEVFDPMSESLLITATAPSAASKTKTLELYNPTSVVEIKHTGMLSFKWSFKWEEHEFEWKREQCFLIRKPDPPVLVAVTREASRQVRATQVQILDYNLHRFEIDDRKGLEIVILTALMTFHDAKDSDSGNSTAALESSPTSPQSEQPPGGHGTLSRVVSGSMVPVMPPLNFGGEHSNDGGPPPPPPPKPAKKTGLDRVQEMQALKGEEYNQITVEDEGSVADYAQYCNNLLSDDAMLFISVRSSAAEFVPKVLQIVEETKRIRYKAGLDEENELHQYVLYDTEKKKGPRRINLNDDAEQKAKYTPPSDLIVHLSKIDMPELKPKTTATSGSKKRESVAIDSSKSKSKSKSKVSPPSSKPPTPPPASSSKSSSSKPSSKIPPAPSAPSPSPAALNATKPQKSKLAKPPRDKSPKGQQKNPELAPPVGKASRPVSGIFNSRPQPPPQSSGALGVSFPTNNYSGSTPSFPTPYGGNSSSSSAKYNSSAPETPGLSLYSSFMPHTPAPAPAGSGSGAPPPPPPPPQGQQAGKTHNLNADMSNLIQKPSLSGATAVVSGLFDMVKSHRK